MPREFQTSKPVGKTPMGNPDNVVSLDLSMVNTLQIGYQAETLYLKKAEDDKLTIKEYIGLEGSEFFAKVSSNRVKTTIRYGRRDSVNTESCVEIYLPEDFSGELQLSTQYGEIMTEDDWEFARFAAETSEGKISMKTLKCPRIRLATSSAPIHVDHTIGFTDLHSVSGDIKAECVDGGARLNTSDSSIDVCFSSVDNLVECETLNGKINLVLPKENGLIIEGISKTGEIDSSIPELSIKVKPGNVKHITGSIGEKPFNNFRISSINGDIILS